MAVLKKKTYVAKYLRKITIMSLFFNTFLQACECFFLCVLEIDINLLNIKLCYFYSLNIYLNLLDTMMAQKHLIWENI